MPKPKKLESRTPDARQGIAIPSLCVPEGEGDCVCHGAVKKGYANLRLSGLPDPFAREAAVAIYQWHHPEADHGLARQTVEYWLKPERAH